MIHSGLFSSSSVVSEREFNLKKKGGLEGRERRARENERWE